MISKILFFTSILGIYSTSAVQAAEVQISNDQECRVEIVGPIEEGDMDALSQLAEHLIVENGESTSASVLCLDSPGGSVIEGMAMATFILEHGISTRIRAETECASICAIMFMMGNYRGSEVAGLSRRMHYTSQLGFHRPYLRADEALLYTSNDLESIYDLGMETVFDILTVANQREPWGTAQMIEPDLMQRITGTPGEDMFYVSTVEEAARWRINIDGIPENIQPTTNRLHFACENALAYPVALTSELNGDEGILGQAIFDFAPLVSYEVEQIATRMSVAVDRNTQIASLRAGYAGVGCQVQVRETYVSVCGYDGITDVSVGDCSQQYGMRSHSLTTMLHPKTQLLTFAFPDIERSDARRLTFCQTYDALQALTDSQFCLHGVALVIEGNRSFARHYLLWPSGSRTVIEIDALSYGQTSTEVRINGSPGASIPFKDDANCIANQSTGNTICVRH